MTAFLRWLPFLFFACLCGGAHAEPARDPSQLPHVLLPPIGLQVADLGVVVNDADPASVETAAYYAARRGIAPERMFHVSFTPGHAVMSESEFLRVQAQLREKLPAGVQALALAWTLPYRVDCMSVTSAFAFGFDRAFCANGCRTTRTSSYFDSDSNAPFTALRIRPAMLLAGRDVAAVKAMIDRGVRSDNTWPAGKAYLLDTSDSKRNVRAETFARTAERLKNGYAIERVRANAIEGRVDAMFVFTGTAEVPYAHANHFLDGALADHLTSFGGVLVDSPQTSALEWLDAGATGSYGTVAEPCSFREKFPEVPVAMGRYLGGETLIEAYWKSVRMPGQGVFIGEPLARPFGGVRLSQVGAQQQVRTRLLRPGNYLLQASAGRVGPYRTVGRVRVSGYASYDLRLPAGAETFFRLTPAR
jgi:uncharacterized protein (TIGR03790 family)